MNFTKRFALSLLLPSTLALSSLRAEEQVLLAEDGKTEPLPKGLEFHHGSWKFGEGAMIGEQVPTEKHLATIKGLV